MSKHNGKRSTRSLLIRTVIAVTAIATIGAASAVQAQTVTAGATPLQTAQQEHAGCLKGVASLDCSQTALTLVSELIKADKPSEAETLLRPLLDLVLDDRTRGVAFIYLARSYRMQRKLDSAYVAAEAALAALERAGPDSQLVIISAESERATIRYEQAQYGAAESILRSSVDRFRNHGLATSSWISLLSNYSRILTEQGKYVDAKLQINAAVAAAQASSEPGIELTLARLLTTRALLHVSMGNPSQAATDARAAIEIYQPRISRDDPRLLEAIQYFAFARSQSGNVDDAIDLGRRLVEAWRRNGEPSVPQLAASMSWLASAYIHGAQFEKAESLARESYHLDRRVLGPEHPATLNARFVLGSILATSGKFDEASEELGAAIAGRERQLPTAGSISLAVWLSEYGRSLRRIGRTSEAEKALVRSIAMMNGLPADDEGLSLARFRYAIVLGDLGRTGSSLAMFRTISAGQSGSEHARVTSSLGMIGTSYVEAVWRAAASAGGLQGR